MPLFMLKKKYFELYASGRKTVELRAVKPQWKNCKPGDVAVLQSGKRVLRRKVKRIYRGSLAKIFLKCDYRKILPDAESVLEAVQTIKELYPTSKQFMAFELGKTARAQFI
jgi:ASC-1-like (ASCH) protein